MIYRYEWHLFVAVYFLACVQFIQCIDLFDVHKNGTVFADGRQVFFAWNHTKHEISDRYTFIAYGNWEPQQGSAELKALPRGEDINSLWAPNTPFKFVLDANGNAYGENLFLEISPWVYGYMNAALVYRPAPFGDWIVKLAKNSTNSKDGGGGYEYRGESEFRLLRVDPAAHTHLNGASLGANFSLVASWVRSHLHDLTSSSPSVPYLDAAGVDPRLVVVEGDPTSGEASKQGRVSVIFAVQPHKRATVLYTADVNVHETSLSLSSPQKIATHDTPLYSQHSAQKNWIPFSFKNDLYYVSHLWPFNAAKLTETHVSPRNFPSNKTKVVDNWIVNMGVEMPWRWGSPHGSTQAVRMVTGEYLCFFHSYTGHRRDRVAQTYVIGAATWRAIEIVENGTKDVRFQMTRITKNPLIPTQKRCKGKCQNFYSDRWLHDQRLYGFIDYAIFPVSLAVDAEYAYMAFAYQNNHNYVAKVDLSGLLEEMVIVA